MKGRCYYDSTTLGKSCGRVAELKQIDIFSLEGNRNEMGSCCVCMRSR